MNEEDDCDGMRFSLHYALMILTLAGCIFGLIKLAIDHGAGPIIGGALLLLAIAILSLLILFDEPV